MASVKQQYPFLPAGATVCTVSQLTDQVRRTLEAGFDCVWVEGEISNLARPSSGHVYLTLKDAIASLRCVMYRGQAEQLPRGFRPRDGIEVVAFGRISVYPPRGEYQLLIDRMFPKGLGALELALQQLREKLAKLGYFDTTRKKPLPRFPRSICVIASATGAAVHDVLEILGQRWPAARVAVRPSRVQGDGAAEEIAATINQVNRWKALGRVQVDVIIIGRGGGSAEDLGAFNQESVAQAIYHSRIPIISAVGHEVDVTIADLVADVRASTPSHAAELATPDRIELLDLVRGLGERLHESTGRRFQFARRQLDELARRQPFMRPLDRVREPERKLDEWHDRLNGSARRRLENTQHSLQTIAARLDSLSPLNVLARGYSLTRAEHSPALLRSASDVKPGDRIVSVLQKGKITSRVESTEAGTPASPAPSSSLEPP